jgi:hypothetical protein
MTHRPAKGACALARTDPLVRQVTEWLMMHLYGLYVNERQRIYAQPMMIAWPLLQDGRLLSALSWANECTGLVLHFI